MAYPFPDGPTIVGNPDANSVDNGYGFRYNPIAASQVAEAQRQAAEAEAAEQQRQLEEQAAQLQQAYGQYANGIDKAAATKEQGLDPTGEFNFTALAQQNGWADSSTFRREKLLNAWADELTKKGATPEYIAKLKAGVIAKAAEMKQPVTHYDRSGGGVVGDVAAAAVGSINSLAGLAGDITSGICFEKAGAALKQGSDSTIGEFERGLQSEETADLLKHANELMGDGDWKGLATFVRQNPSLAAYVGAREFVGSKGIGTAAKGVVKGIDLAVNTGKVVNAASKGAKLGEAAAAVKAANAARQLTPIVEKARTGLGLGVVGGVLGRGSTINNAQAEGIEITDEVRDIANTNALAQAALGFLGGAAGSAEARLGNTNIRSLFKTQAEFDEFAISAATAPKKAASFLKELGKTLGVELPQEYLENFTGSLSDARVVKNDMGGGDLTQKDYDRAKAEGVFGAIAAVGPSLGAAGLGNISERRQVNAFNSEISRQQIVEAANVNHAKAQETAEVARNEAILAAQRTAADAMQDLTATRAQREASNAAAATIAAQAEADAQSADPLVAARAAELSLLTAEHAYAQDAALNRFQAQTEADRQAVEQQNTADAAERRARFIDMANKQIQDSEAAGDTATADNVRALLSTYTSTPPPTRNNAVWEQAVTDGGLQQLQGMAPEIDFNSITGTSRDFQAAVYKEIDKSDGAGDTDTSSRLRKMLSTYEMMTTNTNADSKLSPRDVVEGRLDANGVPVSQSQGLKRVAEIINAGVPVDVEAELMALSPNGFGGIGGSPARISFLTSLPVDVQQRLQALDTQNPTGQFSLPGFYNTGATPETTATEQQPSTPASPLGDLVPPAAQTLAGGAEQLADLGSLAGYTQNATNPALHQAMTDTALALSQDPALTAANQALVDGVPGALNEYNARRRALLETFKAPKQRALLGEYLKLASRAQRRNMSTSNVEQVEEASDALSKWSYEYLAEYAGIQETPRPVRVDNDTEMPRVKYREASWTPGTIAEQRKNALAQQVTPSAAVEQARADKIATVRSALSGLGLGKFTSSEQITNERNNLKVSIDEIKARLSQQEQLLATAEVALASTAKGDAINRGVLTTAVSTRKKNVTAINNEMKKVLAKLKVLDPVAHLELQREQDARILAENIKNKQAALDDAIAAKDLYQTTNALAAATKKYATDTAKLDNNIKKAQRAVDAATGDGFNFELQKAQIESNYAQAVEEAIAITPETLRSFASKVDANNAKSIPGTDFIAAFNKDDHEINGTATRATDNSHWITQWTDTNGQPQSTTFTTSEEVFNHFNNIGLMPTLKSVSSGQSTHGVKAYDVEKRSGRFSNKLLSGMQTVFGKNTPKILNGLDYLEFQFVTSGASLHQLDRHLEVNGLVTNFSDDVSMKRNSITAFATQKGVSGNMHLPDHEALFDSLAANMTPNAKQLFANYVHARGAATRHEHMMTGNRAIDPNTGLTRKYTSGFSYVDPTTGQTVEDASGERYMDYINRNTTPQEKQMMENATKQLAYIGVIVSRMEARNGIIDEAKLQNRVTEFENGKFYFPLKDKDASGGLGKSAKGRHSTADDPALRMLLDVRARLNKVAQMAQVMELYDFAIEHPMPDIFTLNTRVEVADGQGSVKWVTEDPFSNRTIRLVKPDGTKVAMTFAEDGIGQRIYQHLTPSSMPQFVHYLGTAKRWFSDMVTTYAPTTQMAAIMRDILTVPMNFEHASRRLFDSATSARLSAKVMAGVPIKMAGVIHGQINNDERSVINKHIRADGGFIQMTHRRGYNQQEQLLISNADYQPADTAGLRTKKLVGKAKGFKVGLDEIIHSLDIIPRESYADVAIEEVFGRKVRTEEDMALFKAEHAEAYKKIVLGTKDITLDFEQSSNNPYLRNLIPFFGTAMNATFRVLPRALTTKSALGYMALIVGASYLTALAEGEGGEDDEDGKKKYFRGKNLDRQFCLGGVCVPLPQELMVMHMLGTAAAAVQTNQWSIGEASMNIAGAAGQAYSPVQFSESPNFGDKLLSVMPYGFVMGPLITQRDYYGKEFANARPYGADGKPIENPFDWERAYKNSPEWTMDVTKGAFDLSGGLIDVSPGGADATARVLLGGVYNYANQAGKTDPVTALFSRYTYKPNNFGVQEQFAQYEEKYNRLARDPAIANNLLHPVTKVNAILQEASKRDKEYARQMGDIDDTIAKAQADNDTSTLAQATADKENLAKQRNALKGDAFKQIYALEKL